MVYKEFGATIAPSNVSSTGFPIAMGSHIGGGRVVNNKTTLNSKHWCLLGEGATLNDQKANAIGQIWYDISDNKYWKLDSWASTNPVWVDVSTIFATKSYVDTAIENIPDPMIFKGSLGTGGTITSLPTASNSNIGFTYKVITAGTYAGQVAKVGDTFISDGTTWNLIPSGDEPSGTVTSITLDATSPILIDSTTAITTSGTRTFSHASTSGNKHIPSGGSTNQILRWTADGTADWSNEVNTHYTSKNIVSSSITGITNANTTNPYLNHIEESTITSSHRINGSGATTVSSDVGGNITISSTDTDTTYSFETGTTNGTFKVTPSGGSATTVSIYGLGSAAYTSSADYASSSHNHSVFTTTENGFVPKSVTSNTTDFLRRDGSWATPPDTTYTLPLASSTTRGGIKIGYTATGANLPLLLSSEKGYVKLTSSSITSALEYTPYDSTNPNNYTSNTGTVTNIATGTGLSGGPITTTGTINLATEYGDSVNPYGSKTATYVLAAPNASDGVPSFRALVASDIVTSSITFNDGGTGDASETTYNGSTARTISYNTIGAAASSHTHNTYENQTLTSGDGMDAWTATNGDLTIALGTPSTITGSSTNSLTSTSHTHAILITPANIGAAPSSHTHDYSLLDNLPAIYNADHAGVPTDDFDTLYDEPNNVWLCIDSMRNGPLNDSGNTNPSYNIYFDHCVVQQFGKDTKIQVLYITTGNVANLSNGSIFYRMQGDKWKRIATYSDIANLQTQIDSLDSTVNNLTTTVNNKQDKMSEIIVNVVGTSYANRETIQPIANHTLNINCPYADDLYIHLNFLNSLDEAIILLNTNDLSGATIDVNYAAEYKVAGMMPFFTTGSKWIISIFKGILFFNQIN